MRNFANQNLSVEPLLHSERSQLRWFGHMKQMPLLGGVSGVSHRERDPRKTLGFLGSVDLETPLNPSWGVGGSVGEGRSLGIPATFWGTLLPSTQFLFLHWPQIRNRMKSKLTGLQSLSCKGPERPGFDHETPSVPLLESYRACLQSYWVECVNFRINKGRLLTSNTFIKTILVNV